MPHAALTPAAPSDPAAVRPRPAAATKRRGNRNLGLAPAPPARGLDPRAYAPAPDAPAAPPRSTANSVAAHGGRSPGRRTPESLPRPRPVCCIRVRDARTIHGNYGVNARRQPPSPHPAPHHPRTGPVLCVA